MLLPTASPPDLGLPEIVAVIDPRNAASVALAVRSGLRFRLESLAVQALLILALPGGVSRQGVEASIQQADQPDSPQRRFVTRCRRARGYRGLPGDVVCPDEAGRGPQIIACWLWHLLAFARRGARSDGSRRYRVVATVKSPQPACQREEQPDFHVLKGRVAHQMAERRRSVVVSARLGMWSSSCSRPRTGRPNVPRALMLYLPPAVIRVGPRCVGRTRGERRRPPRRAAVRVESVCRAGSAGGVGFAAALLDLARRRQVWVAGRPRAERGHALAVDEVVAAELAGADPALGDVLPHAAAQTRRVPRRPGWW